jgi:hypothetical protein
MTTAKLMETGYAGDGTYDYLITYDDGQDGHLLIEAGEVERDSRGTDILDLVPAHLEAIDRTIAECDLIDAAIAAVRAAGGTVRHPYSVRG